MTRQRCCCNCRHNKRKSEKTYVSCRCDIDGHYIDYTETFEGWCKRWAIDRKFNETTESMEYLGAEKR